MMKLKCPNIPKEIDADVALSVIMSCVDAIKKDNVNYRYEFNGVSERTALGDVLKTAIKNKTNDETDVKLSLNRDSLYHILPEFLFHPLDWFIEAEGDAAEFEKRYKEQEIQKQNALSYFKPFDEQFQKLRISLQKWLNENIFNGNQFLANYILSGHQFDNQNRFIKAVLPCVVWLRENRGNDEMIRTALGYAFSGKALIDKERRIERTVLSGNVHSSLDGTTDDLFVGDTAEFGRNIWKVRYQTAIDSEESLLTIKQQLKEFKVFFEDWFLSIEDLLEIEFGDWQAEPFVSTNKSNNGIFLNYSTQLI